MEAGRAFFWVVAGATLLSGLFVVTSRNVVRAAIWLAATLFLVAIVYVTLSADFLAVIQVLVYIGGIIVMILFTVMFTRKSGEGSYVAPSKGPLTIILAALFTGAIFYMLYEGFITSHWAISDARGTAPTVRGIGDVLLTEYVLPFEVVSILLLMALVGAVILIKKEVKEEAPTSGS